MQKENLSLLEFERIAPKYSKVVAQKEQHEITKVFEKLKSYVTKINVIKKLDLVQNDEDTDIAFIRQSVLFTEIYDVSNSLYDFEKNYISVYATVMSITGEVFPVRFYLNYWAHMEQEDIFAGGEEDTIRIEFGNYEDYQLNCALVHPDSWDEDEEYSEMLRWIKSVAALLRLSSQKLEKLNTLWTMLIGILVPAHLRKRFAHFQMQFDRDSVPDVTYEELEQKRLQMVGSMLEEKRLQMAGSLLRRRHYFG